MFYIVKGRAIGPKELNGYNGMRTKLLKYEGPRDYIKELSNKIRLRPNLESHYLYHDDHDVWSKVISDGDNIVLYRGISNQVIDCIGQLALDGKIAGRPRTRPDASVASSAAVIAAIGIEPSHRLAFIGVVCWCCVCSAYDSRRYQYLAGPCTGHLTSSGK